MTERKRDEFFIDAYNRGWQSWWFIAGGVVLLLAVFVLGTAVG